MIKYISWLVLRAILYFRIYVKMCVNFVSAFRAVDDKQYLLHAISVKIINSILFKKKQPLAEYMKIYTSLNSLQKELDRSILDCMKLR
jgi:hypothetical protein